ncbi:unnamed protein product [Oikopleura dioica]|uniref:Uncharacterized protein n=1 Tax=Oikopleura dioica TaxID=34765 RepID=E4Y8B8_OIKDI|nr:unnamed protein product [Oikopleura dioica]
MLPKNYSFNFEVCAAGKDYVTALLYCDESSVFFSFATTGGRGATIALHCLIFCIKKKLFQFAKLDEIQFFTAEKVKRTGS